VTKLHTHIYASLKIYTFMSSDQNMERVENDLQLPVDGQTTA